MTEFALRQARARVRAWHLESVGADEIAQRAITALFERAGSPAHALPIASPELWLRRAVRVQALKLLRDLKTRASNARAAAYVRAWRRSSAPRELASSDGPTHPAAWNALPCSDRYLVELFAAARDCNTVAVALHSEPWRVAARLKWIAWRLAWERRRARLPQPDHLLVLLRADGFSIAECAVALDIRQECIKKRLARWARS